MSYDFALKNVCTHEVWFETATIDPFVKDTIRFQSPVSSSNLILYINDVIVPRTGLNSNARLICKNAEPYSIKVGVNDLICLSVGLNTSKIYQLNSGNSVSAKDIAENLQKQIPELKVSVKNNRVCFESWTSNQNDTFSFINPINTDRLSVLPSTKRISNCFSELGIEPGRHVVPNAIFPSWSLITDPNSASGEKVIYFSQPIKNSSPVFQVTYITNKQNCRRCFGSEIEYDYSVIDGSYETVSDSDLMLQEFDKFLFTKSGSHWKWPWLGSHLLDRIGSKYVSSDGSTNSFISLDVTQAFKIYQNVKSQQEALQFQQVSDKEFPNDLTNLSVTTDPRDPTIALVTGSIVSRSRDKVVLKRLINPSSSSLFSNGTSPFQIRG